MTKWKQDTNYVMQTNIYQICINTKNKAANSLMEIHPSKTAENEPDLVYADGGIYEFLHTRGLCFEQMLTWRGLPSWHRPIVNTQPDFWVLACRRLPPPFWTDYHNPLPSALTLMGRKHHFLLFFDRHELSATLILPIKANIMRSSVAIEINKGRRTISNINNQWSLTLHPISFSHQTSKQVSCCAAVLVPPVLMFL